VRYRIGEPALEVAVKTPEDGSIVPPPLRTVNVTGIPGTPLHESLTQARNGSKAATRS
jgi:hypothetical protein